MFVQSKDAKGNKSLWKKKKLDFMNTRVKFQDWEIMEASKFSAGEANL